MTGVRVIHALPRRVRLRARALVGQRSASERVAAALARAPMVAKIAVRPSTGSVLVEGDDVLDAVDLSSRLSRLLDAERDDDGHPLSDRRATNVQTRLARALAHAMRELNESVRDALGGQADLGTLLPVFLTGAGVAELAALGRVPAPSWSSLLWYSIQFFLEFNGTDESRYGAPTTGAETGSGSLAPRDAGPSTRTP